MPPCAAAHKQPVLPQPLPPHRATAAPALSCLVRPGFFASFYCLLDAVAVASLAFELPALRAVLLLGATQARALRAAGACARGRGHQRACAALCAAP